MINFAHRIHSIINILKYIFSLKKTAIYVGGYPTISNVGDVALYEAYRFLLSDFRLIHFSGGRLEYFIYRIFAFKRPLAVLAGGTLINHMCLRETKEGKNLFGPLFVFGTGVAQSSYWHGKVGYQIQENDWQEVLKDSPYVGVRGPLSVSQLKKFNIEGDVFGDPVLSLAQLKDESQQNSIPKKVIGLNVGKSLGFVQGGEENLEKTFINLAKELLERGYSLKWFVVCPEDFSVTQKIVGLTGGSVVSIYKDYKEYYSELDEVFLFIGTKLHAVCLSLNVSVPSIMIEYRPKCRDFMSSLELEEFSIPAEKVSVAGLFNKIGEIEKDYSKIVHTINTNILNFQKKQPQVVKNVLQMRLK